MATRIAIFITGFAILFVATSAEQHDVEHSYTGSTGPDNWGNLSPSFSACSNGKSQSPINIVRKDAVFNPKLTPLTRYYDVANATLVNDGHKIGLHFEHDVGVVTVDGKNYTLKTLHWHTPSEHTINGVRYPVELHLVHVSADGKISVVVGILYKYGDPDPLLTQIKGHLDEAAKEKCAENEETHIPIKLMNTRQLERNSRKYFRYFGSLTTPPCTENVIWNVLGKVRGMSKEQVDSLVIPLNKDSKNNSRPTQPINGRQVELYNEMSLGDTT